MAALTSYLPTFARLAGLVRSILDPLSRLALAGVASLIVLVIFHNWQAARHWAAYRQEAAARGVVFDLPDRAAIPDSENFAAPDSPFGPHDPSKPSNWPLDLTGMHLRAPDYAAGERMTTEKAYAQDRQPADRGRHFRRASDPSPPSVPPAPGEPKSAEDLLAIFDRNIAAQWPAILEAESRPKTQFARSPSPFAYQLQYSGLTARKTAQLHGMRAIAFLDLGRKQDALEEVKASFRLARAIEAGPDPSLVSCMIGTAVLSLDLAPVWEGLVDRRWSDSDLLTLRDELSSLHPARQWPLMAEAERTRQNALFDELAAASFATRSADLQKLFGNPKTRMERALWSLSGLCATTGFIRDNQIATNINWDAMSQRFSADGRWHPEIKSSAYDLGKMSDVDRVRYAIACTIVPSACRAACRVAVAEACVRHAILAVALERYRRQHQDLPERLDALVPDFIAAIPHDPLDDQPVRYSRASSEAFRLTSLGDTGNTDDCQVSDVWQSDPKNPKSNVVVWHGLARASNEVIQTAAR